MGTEIRQIRIDWNAGRKTWVVKARDALNTGREIGTSDKQSGAVTIAQDFAEHIFKQEGIRSEIFHFTRGDHTKIKHQYVWPRIRKPKFTADIGP